MTYTLATCEALPDPGEPVFEVELGHAVQSLIEQEGPIHRDEIVRRIAQCLGKSRGAPAIDGAVESALSRLPDTAPEIGHDAEFWFTAQQKTTPAVRERSAAPASLRKPGMIAAFEIRAAIALARQQGSGLGDGELPNAVARLLGLPKPTANLCTLVRTLAA